MNNLATINPKKSSREKGHQKRSTNLAGEGIVLLKNKGDLPFSHTIHRIALFGNGARKSVIGGTGSGAVNVRDFVSIEDGLLNNGYQITTKNYLDDYDRLMDQEHAIYQTKIRQKAQESIKIGLLEMLTHPFVRPNIQTLTESLVESTMADTAVYVVSRISGEGSDRKNEKDDYLLNDTELNDLKTLSKFYHSISVMLNVGGVIDLSLILDIPEITGIVLISQGGSGMGNAVAAILKGTLTPSGKLTATWAKQYSDYPSSSSFLTGSIDTSVYREGIYVGYRYFSTFGIKPLFPFGYGLSYASFSIKIQKITLRSGSLTCWITVENTSKRFSGKEVVQLYVTKPQKPLDTPLIELVGFKKTRLLSPLEKQNLCVKIPIERFASFDCQTAQWVIQEGIHELSLGNQSDKLVPFCRLIASSRMMVEQTYMDKNTVKDDWISPQRAIKESQLKTFIINGKSLQQRIIEKPVKSVNQTPTRKNFHLDDFLLNKISLDDFINDLSNEELMNLCVGNARVNLNDLSMIGKASKSIPGAAGETSELSQRGIPSLSMADGPAGIRVTPKVYDLGGTYFADPKDDPTMSLLLSSKDSLCDLSRALTKYQYCTAIPIETMLAQSWNEKLIRQAGVLVAQEMRELGINLWLAPGMNIQRNPLCGRNFEYFSEDPFLTGVFATALVQGIQSVSGCGAVVKHFACNNQETNRNYNNSVLSTRALREIYLQGFKTVIENAQPCAVMSSYNLINGSHTANDAHLLTDILRNEWRFSGIVMTDWYATNGKKPGKNQVGCSITYQCVQAGNDLTMPGSQEDVDNLKEAYEKGWLTRNELMICAKRIIQTILRLKISK